MTTTELAKQVMERRAEVLALAQLWQMAIKGECPDDSQFYLWLELHPFRSVHQAIRETARKQFKRRGAMSADHLIRFCSRVANQADKQIERESRQDRCVDVAVPA
jgi:hypothetical protein